TPCRRAEVRRAGGREETGEKEQAERDVAATADPSGGQRRGRPRRARADGERGHAALVVPVVGDHAPADAVVAVRKATAERHDELARMPARDVGAPAEDGAAAVPHRL